MLKETALIMLETQSFESVIDWIIKQKQVKNHVDLADVRLSLPDSKLIPALKDALMGYEKKIKDGDYDFIQHNDFQEIAEDLRELLGNEA
jgi:DNA relaxase NicK